VVGFAGVGLAVVGTRAFCGLAVGKADVKPGVVVGFSVIGVRVVDRLVVGDDDGKPGVVVALAVVAARVVGGLVAGDADGRPGVVEGSCCGWAYSTRTCSCGCLRCWLKSCGRCRW
jgi:hypothetical protein